MKRMGWTNAAVIAATAVYGSAVGRASMAEQAPGAAPATVWAGIYTDEQATRGSKVYGEACAGCHGDALEGAGDAPALSGSDFVANWNGTSVGDLLDRIRISMPPGAAESVSLAEKSDIVAYILQQSKFPAGSAELAKEVAPLKVIKFEPAKPGTN